MEEKEIIEKKEEVKEPEFKKPNLAWLIAKQYFFITVGVILVDLGFYFFLDPANICMGGVTGIAIIIKPYVEGIEWFTSSVFIFIVNMICLVLGLIFIGRDFFVKTIYASIISPLILFVFEKTMDPCFFYDTIQESKLLICFLCGSALFGIGIGVAMKYNGSTGGMDVIQKIISKYLRVPMSVTMYGTDLIIVLFSGFVFIGGFTYNIELVVYGAVGVALVGYFCDFVALSLRPRRTMYVITKKPDVIKELIYHELDRGVTLASVTGGWTGDDQTMVICTMDKNESYRMTSIVAKADPKAFTFVTSTKEVRGDYEKRGLL
ncbi:MAG: YitT family protein [Acholeplasmatales bacterium]|nr:YitT family protein [Acholeplasmatales bacterium]